MSKVAHVLVSCLLSLIAFNALAQASPPPPPRPPCCTVPPGGMVDWWTFDEPSGPTSSDIAGAVNNAGTDHGSVGHIPGKVWNATSYNGSSWVEVANQAEVNFLGDCSNDAAEPATIDFWIRTQQGSGTVAVLDKRDRNGNNFLRGYSVYLWNGHLGFQMAMGPGNFSCNSSGSACSNFTSTTTPSVANGGWNFVAVAFSRCRGASGMFYVNGNVSSFQPRVGDITSQSPLYIGRQEPTMGNSFFKGDLDELEYYKRVLSKAELDAIYAAGPYGKCRIRG